jgi:hypothetical protein
MTTPFFTEDFMATQFNTAGPSSAQGQLSSSYTNALSTVLTANADWLGFLAYSANHLSIADAQEVRSLVEAGSFSLAGLFSAAQSKTAAVDGGSITDPQPTLTVTLADSTVVTIDLTKILSDLDTETWTQVDTVNSGKKTSTVTTYHTREFYTDADAPAGYSDDWDDAPPPVLTEHHDQIVETIVKDNSSTPGDTFNVHLDMLGEDWNDLVLKVSATGDYDAANESVTISGDLLANLVLDVPTTIDLGGSNSDNALNDLFAAVTVTATSYADGSVDLVVAFTNQVNNGSSVTLTLDYDYWAV